MSVHSAPPNVGGVFFQKKLFRGGGGANLFGQKIYGKVVLDRRTSDQIMPTWVRSSVNDKFIFQ